MTLDEILQVYRASDGEATRRMYAALEACGHRGLIAVNLLRACKTSERAKKYRRGPGHKTAAYQTKDWSIGNLAQLLVTDDCGFSWGWAIDAELQARDDPHHHIVYLELPTGQVSFHVGARHGGPDYAGSWDGVKDVAADRICRWAAAVLHSSRGQQERSC
jgi:photosystem II stability/assembly factor-like uncharacterized protein